MNTTTTSNSKILYIDDDSDDCIFLMESLIATGSTAELVCASNAEEGINYLVNTESLPSLILLDLNLPKWDGKQTLVFLKSHPVLSSIPVVIFSTSQNNADREVCSRLGASSFISKPFHFEEYKNLVQSFTPFLQSA